MWRLTCIELFSGVGATPSDSRDNDCLRLAGLEQIQIEMKLEIAQLLFKLKIISPLFHVSSDEIKIKFVFQYFITSFGSSSCIFT